ncbi:uncharacterized protein TNCV_1513781 [Trichonephila clavipes]|nr:uncharacterized protein TNCV_1513781 [Trichonephila clavipes]
MACDTKDCGFQILNDDGIVTSVQEESDPVDSEADEDEGNNNESSKGASNADAFSALETAMEWSWQFGGSGNRVVRVVVGIVFVKSRFVAVSSLASNSLRR